VKIPAGKELAGLLAGVAGAAGLTLLAGALEFVRDLVGV
jgi:hypothetical protein